MKKILSVVTALLFASFSFADTILPDLENHFQANFKIDSMHTTDGTNYQVSVSGEQRHCKACMSRAELFLSFTHLIQQAVVILITLGVRLISLVKHSFLRPPI